MFYYKINNLLQNNKCDYKGLNIDLIYGGTQVYPKDLTKYNMCLVCTTEDIKSNGDLEQITEEEYLKLKAEIEEENKKDIPQNIDKEKETFTQTLAELTIEDKKKDVMIANLAETVAKLTIEVNQLKGSAQ